MIAEISIELILPSPDQPRTTFPPSKIRQLAATIERDGLLNPVLVRRGEAGRCVLICGEMRVRAHKLLAETNSRFAKIQARVLDVDRETARLMTLEENLCRKELSPIERARG